MPKKIPTFLITLMLLIGITGCTSNEHQIHVEDYAWKIAGIRSDAKSIAVAPWIAPIDSTEFQYTFHISVSKGWGLEIRTEQNKKILWIFDGKSSIYKYTPKIQNDFDAPPYEHMTYTLPLDSKAEAQIPKAILKAAQQTPPA